MPPLSTRLIHLSNEEEISYFFSPDKSMSYEYYRPVMREGHINLTDIWIYEAHHYSTWEKEKNTVLTIEATELGKLSFNLDVPAQRGSQMDQHFTLPSSKWSSRI